ncbi:MAG: DNA polymerase III subunit alpha [Candidatus Pacebacteria bacterium CG10_big_fil_rev_8_21_14_0_10_56_10]|nr:MAG: DNA polymerase III subunit alpha [Candidatus Pacebacteria bacterium CG10_big_fil_rev_8_21_14_0_10_56_10]
MPAEFVHLHVHTEYSMLDGLNKIDPRNLGDVPLLAAAKQHGQTALAITDHGGMYGCLHFYNACRRYGIKPIIGVEAYMAGSSRHDKQTRPGTDQFHLTILAENFTGYQNLLKLVSAANLEGMSYRPRIDTELLFAHHQGLVVTTGCMSSLFGRSLLGGQAETARELAGQFRDVFADHFYVELQRHDNLPQQDELNTKLIELARQLKLPLVATNDVHYIRPDDAAAQDALLCVQTRKLLSDDNRMSIIDSPSFYLKSSQEMTELFHDYPEAVQNTVAIAERCDLTIPTGNLIFPSFPLPDEAGDEAGYLEQLATDGLKRRFTEITPELKDRLEYEINIINTKGYATYFLITADFVNWAKDQGIAVGPGRGSVAGSLVAYCLGITTINPLQHGLPFERFLNPERPTPPDVDMDFADNRRDEVIEYVANKYGRDRVAHVITFGRMEARVAVRDIGRVLGMPYEEPDRVAKLIPNAPGAKTSLQHAISSVSELDQLYQQPKYRRLLDLAMKVEGVIRHSSVHAAAVIIADKPLREYTPIQPDPKSGKMLTQYDMYALDLNISDQAIGLLKFDFLGLRNLTIIQRALELLKQHRNLEIDLASVPIDDAKTYQLLSDGETMGVFQLESAGMRRVARSLKPSQFSDITAMVALFRPGPMDLIPQFIEGKHRPETIKYPHPSLQDILKETYGVMVYQEQILQIANTMAGYSLSEADILRRAIGKKKKSLLDKNKKRFIEDSVKNNYSSQVATKVWNYIEAFANYGFNKAHAASYAMIAYQTAYLKANYPVEYMAALMSVEAGSHATNRDEKVTHAIETSKRMGIVILPPDINASQADFTLEDKAGSLEGKAIRFGLSAVKHVGTAAIAEVLTQRRQHGEFGSFTQFIQQTDGRKVNKKVLECLIKVGAMDQFASRASMLEQLDDIRQRAQQFQSDIDGQDTLFGTVTTSATLVQDTFRQLPEYPRAELLSFEKSLLGLFLSEHPMARQLQAIRQQAQHQIADLDSELHAEHIVTIGGMLVRLREVTTRKSGKPMAFGSLEDETGSLEVVFFPKTYQQYQRWIKPDAVVLVKGKLQNSDEEFKLIADKVSVSSEVVTEQASPDLHHELFIPRKTDKATLERLAELLKAHPGQDSVVILVPNGEAPKRLLLPYTVSWSDDLAAQAEKLLS